MADSLQVELVKQRMAELELQQAEVQKKLDRAEGFFGFGCWLSSKQLEILNEEKKFLFQEIKKTNAELKQLYAPPPPPPTKWQTLEGSGGDIAYLMFVGTAISGCGAAFFAFRRLWAMLRMRHAPYTTEQWHCRRGCCKWSRRSPF